MQHANIRSRIVHAAIHIYRHKLVPSVHATTWSFVKASTATPKVLPTVVHIYAEEQLPVRTAKIHTTFRKEMLEHILAEKRITGDMVLFICYCCKERFVTFHPLHIPPFKLDVLASYPWEISHWDTQPPAGRSKYATLHTQECVNAVHKT